MDNLDPLEVKGPLSLDDDNASRDNNVDLLSNIENKLGDTSSNRLPKESLQDKNFSWDAFVEGVEKSKPTLVAALNNCKYISFYKNTLTVEAKYSFHKERLEINSTKNLLEKPGRMEQVDEWYYDTAANTLQNGGAAAAGIEPTALSLLDIEHIMSESPF